MNNECLCGGKLNRSHFKLSKVVYGRVRCSWGEIACLFLIVQRPKNMTARNRSISRGNFYSTPSPPTQRDHSSRSSLDITRSSSSSSSWLHCIVNTTILSRLSHYIATSQRWACSLSELYLYKIYTKLEWKKQWPIWEDEEPCWQSCPTLFWSSCWLWSQ